MFEDIVWDRESVCTCRQSLGLCDCVYVWTEFGIVRNCVRVDKVWERVSVFMCKQGLGSCECVNVWTKFGIV